MINNSYKFRLKKLAGIISENEVVKNNSDKTLLQTGVGMILKLNPGDLDKTMNVSVPTEDLTTNSKMYKLPNDKIHITLTSIKSFKPFKKEFDNYVLSKNIEIPNIEIGECKFVHRPDDNKVTYVMSLKNQGDFRSFVDNVYRSLGIENPEPNRFYHITLANNEGGNPFKSIGDVTIKDFEK